MRKSSIIILICLLLTGCRDSAEIDSRAYPVAMAVDIGEKEKIEIALQFSARGDKGKDDSKNKNTVITAEGDNIFEAYEKLDDITGKKLSASQLNALIISDEFAKMEGIKDIIFELVNAHRGFKNMFVVLSNGSAVEYLDKQEIWLENTPSKFYSIFLENSLDTFYQAKKISEIAFSMLSDNEQVVIPYISFVKSQTEDESKSEDVKKTEENKQKFRADDVEALSPQKSELNKLGVFKGGKLISELEDEDIIAYGLLRGEYTDGYISVPMGDGSYVNLTVQNRERNRVKVNIDGDTPRIDISFNLRVIHMDSETASNYDYNAKNINSNSKAYVEKICRSLLHRSVKEFDADIFGFASPARLNFLFEQDFTEYNWREKYKNSKFNVYIKIINYNNHVPFEV